MKCGITTFRTRIKGLLENVGFSMGPGNSIYAHCDWLSMSNEEHGRFRLLDMDNTRLMGTARLQAELAIRAGKVVYDLNGFSMDAWDDPHTSSNPQMASHWTGFRPRPPLPEQVHPRMSKSKEASGCFSTAPAAKPLYWV